MTPQAECVSAALADVAAARARRDERFADSGGDIAALVEAADPHHVLTEEARRKLAAHYLAWRHAREAEAADAAA